MFRKSGRAVPVFTDKHLSYDWTKAKADVRLVARAEVSADGRVVGVGDVSPSGAGFPARRANSKTR